MPNIYLDHQASTPLSPGVAKAMSALFSTAWANPHSDDHAAGWDAAAVVDRARVAVAAAIGAEAEEVVFTSGATEANNLALLGVAEAMDGRTGRVVVSAVDHKSVLAPARALARRGWELAVAPVGRDGLIDLDELARLAAGATLVSVGAVNNEIGVVQPMSAIAGICRAAGALLHTDVTQALSWGAADVVAMGADFASLSSHKAGGPKGIGALYVALPTADRIAPLFHGGGQEGGLRPGTVPTPLCAGFAAACSALPDEEAVARWRGVTGLLLRHLEKLVPGTVLNGAATPRHPGNLNVMLPGADADAVLARVQPRLAAARGSACTSGIPEPSHVLAAIGLTSDEAERSIRLSTGPATTMEEVETAARMIAAACSELAAGERQPNGSLVA